MKNPSSIKLVIILSFAFLLLFAKVSYAALTATPNPQTLSNALVDVGQTSVANTVISGGTASYTANIAWNGPNTTTRSNTILALLAGGNRLGVVIKPFSSNSLEFTFNGVNYFANAIGTNTIYGNWTISGFAKDSGTNTVTVSNVLEISPAFATPVAPTITGAITPNPDNPTFNQGQTVFVIGTMPPGTSPFSWQWQDSFNGGAFVNSPNSVCLTSSGSGAASGAYELCIFNTNALTASGTYNFRIQVTDGSSTPQTATSANTIITLGLLQIASTTNSLFVSNSIIDVGQISVVNTIVNPGNGGPGAPYTGQWVITSTNLTNTFAGQLNLNSADYVKLNPSGSQAYVTFSADENIIVVNTLQNVAIKILTNSSISFATSIAFSPTGSLAYITTDSGLQIVNTINYSVVNSISLVNSFGDAINPSGTLVYVTQTSPDQINVVDTATNTVISSIAVGDSPISVAFNPSGTLAYVVNAGDGDVSVIDVVSNTVINTITVGSNPQVVAFNPSGTLAYVTNENDHDTSVINVATNTVINSINVGDDPTEVAFGPSGTFAYVINSADSDVSVIKTATNTVVNTILSSGFTRSIAIAPSGNSAYITTGSGLEVANLIANSPIDTFTVPPGSQIQGIGVNPNGKQIFEADQNGNVLIVNTISGNVIVIPSNTFGSTSCSECANLQYSVAFNPSGTLAYISGERQFQSVSVLQECNIYVINTISANLINTIAVNTFADVSPGLCGRAGIPVILQNNGPQSIAINSTTNTLYVAQDGINIVSAVNLITNTVINNIIIAPIGAQDNAFDLALKGQFLYVTSQSNDSVSVIDTAFQDNVIAVIPVGRDPSGIALDPSYPLAYVTNQDDGTVSVIDTTTLNVINTISVGGSPIGIQINPSGTLVYVTNLVNQNISIIDVETNTVLNTVYTWGTNPISIAFSPTNNIAYVASRDTGTITIINTTPTITAYQNLPTIQTTNAIMQITVNALTSNQLVFVFNGVTYQTNLPPLPLVYGKYSLYSFANDLSGDTSNSANVLVINPPFNAIALFNASNQNIFTTQNQILTANLIVESPGTGTPPYTYNFQVFNAVGDLVANILESNSLTVNTFTFTIQQIWGTGVFSANLVVSDHASFPETAVNSLTFNVFAPVIATPNPESVSNSLINTGEVSVANTVISQGTGEPYSGEWTLLIPNATGSFTINQPATLLFPDAFVLNPSNTAIYVIASQNVSIVNTATNSVVKNIFVGSDPTQIAINPSGTLIYVTDDQSGTVNVISTATNTVVATITLPNAGSIFINGVAFNPSGTLAYVSYSDSGTLAGNESVIDVATNSVINTIPVGNFPQGIAFNPSGTLAYVTDLSFDDVNVIDVATNSVVNSIPVGLFPSSIAINAQGTLAYVTNQGSSNVTVIDLTSNTAINSITTSSSPGQVIFGPTGSLAYVLVSGSDELSVINIAQNSIVNNVSLSSELEGIGYDLNSNTIYVSSQQFPIGIYAINALSNTVIGIIGGGRDPTAIATNPQGTEAYITNYTTNSVTVLSTITNTIVNTIELGNFYPINVTFNPSGTLAYIVASNGNNQGNILVINTQTNTIVSTIMVGNLVLDAAFNPSGTLAYVTNGDDSTLSVINVATNTIINTISVPDGVAGSIAFASGGNLAYVPSFVGVSVVDVATNSVATTISDGESSGFIRANPLGTLLFLTQFNETIGVIDAQTNTVINSIPVDGDPIDMAINPSGTFDYVTTDSGNVSVIDIGAMQVLMNVSVTPPSTVLTDIAINPSGTFDYVISSASPTLTVTAIPQIVFETAYQPLPTTQTINGLTVLTITAISTNTIGLNFNGNSFTESPIDNLSILGNYIVYGFGRDNSGFTTYNAVDQVVFSNANFTIGPGGSPTTSTTTLSTTSTTSTTTSASTSAGSSIVPSGGGTPPGTTTIRQSPLLNVTPRIVYIYQNGTYVPGDLNVSGSNFTPSGPIQLYIQNNTIVANYTGSPTGTFAQQLPVASYHPLPGNGSFIAYDVDSGLFSNKVPVTYISLGNTVYTNLSDNVNFSFGSNVPVFNVSVVFNGTVIQQRTYYQNQLPIAAGYPSTGFLNFTFACSFSTGSQSDYSYANQIIGIGPNNPCETVYKVRSGSYEVIYTINPLSRPTTIMFPLNTTTISGGTTVPGASTTISNGTNATTGTNSTSSHSKTSTSSRNDLIILAIIILFVAPTTVLLIRRRLKK